jgi:hypothetical protein
VAVNKLPATLQEAEALSYARECVRMVKNDKISFFGLPLSWFERDDSRRWWKQWLKITAMTPDGMLDLYEAARAGDGPSHEVLCELIRWHHHNRAEMPPVLATYDMQVVRAASDPKIQAPPRKRGPKGKPALLRDLAVVWLVGVIRWKFGLKPYRSKLSRSERMNACRVVYLALEAERLAVSEDTIIAIQARWGDHAFPPGTLARPYPD